jgi:Family of unknown function (DUF6082)
MASERSGTKAWARRHLSSHIRRWAGRLLEQQAEYTHKTALIHQQRLHWELLSKAIDDPELAEVLDVYEGAISPRERRQFLFANAIYTNQLLAYRIGNITLEEFYDHVRGLLQNTHVRKYWRASREQRASLAPDSDEARLGHIIDDLLEQLEEADEEWWVVGDPPTE